MQFFSSLIRLSSVALKHQGAVVTIGNFDGVHTGHKRLIKKLITIAKGRSLPSLVITFEPHPLEFFKRNNVTVPRLTSLKEKCLALKLCGVDYVLVLPFKKKLADMKAFDFVQKILVDTLKVSHILMGEDFHFGYKRAGNTALLETLGKKLGFSVETFPSYFIQEERVSSTRIREALAEGDHALAKLLLGGPYIMMGKVGYGDRLGRKLGFPTANISLRGTLSPLSGVYTVLVKGIDKNPLPGVASVGTRPTVDGKKTVLEVHLLHFNRNIYGQSICVEFCTKIRGQQRFESLAKLSEAITKDVEVAMQYFALQG